jgi:hypothetical protein
LAVNTNQSINIYPKSHNILVAEILLKLALNTNQSINIYLKTLKKKEIKWGKNAPSEKFQNLIG